MPLRKLEPSFSRTRVGNHEIWTRGSPTLRAKSRAVPIGEVWFETPEVPLLVKFLFTEKDLSVQVHPDDAYARLHHNSPGKTEMWHVLSGARTARRSPPDSANQ